MERTSDELKRLRHERETLQARYPLLLEEIGAILLRHDPAAIQCGDDPEEYAPEAGTILVRLERAGSPADVRRIVQQEFLSWFEPVMAGPEEQYAAIADEIWAAWSAHLTAR